MIVNNFNKFKNEIIRKNEEIINMLEDNKNLMLEKIIQALSKQYGKELDVIGALERSSHIIDIYLTEKYLDQAGKNILSDVDEFIQDILKYLYRNVKYRNKKSLKKTIFKNLIFNYVSFLGDLFESEADDFILHSLIIKAYLLYVKIEIGDDLPMKYKYELKQAFGYVEYEYDRYVNRVTYY